MNLHIVFSVLLIILIGCDQRVAVTQETSSTASVDPQTTDETIELTRASGAPPEPAAAGTEFFGKVVAIIDGDTIDILTTVKTKVRIRLNGIDAPEIGQPFGRTATEFLSNSIGGRVIRVVSHGQDRYGRIIGDVFSTEQFLDPIQPGKLLTGPDKLEVHQDLSGLSVTMVMNGFAWHYVKYAPDRQDLAEAERWARSERLRLWSDDRRIAPWDWRKLSKEEREKLR